VSPHQGKPSVQFAKSKLQHVSCNTNYNNIQKYNHRMEPSLFLYSVFNLSNVSYYMSVNAGFFLHSQSTMSTLQARKCFRGKCTLLATDIGQYYTWSSKTVGIKLTLGFSAFVVSPCCFKSSSPSLPIAHPATSFHLTPRSWAHCNHRKTASVNRVCGCFHSSVNIRSATILCVNKRCDILLTKVKIYFPLLTISKHYPKNVIHQSFLNV
jgi:hypothetical protein